MRLGRPHRRLARLLSPQGRRLWALEAPARAFALRRSAPQALAAPPRPAPPLLLQSAAAELEQKLKPPPLWTPPSDAAVDAGAAAGLLPEDFGALGGTPIRNKDTVLQEIDLAVARITDPEAARGRPPDVEVLFTEHKAYRGDMLGLLAHHMLFRWGHGLIRYTLPDGRQYCMNILGGEGLHLPGGQLVNLSDPKEYLYGTNHFTTGNQQGGLYNGAMVGVRIEQAPTGATEALHAYFMALDKRSRVGDRVAGPGSRGAIAQFQIIGGRTWSWIQENFPRVRYAGPGVRQTVLAGNCAQWTSMGMKWAGLIHRSRMFPKAILVDILEDQWFRGKKGRDNVHVVYYDQVLDDDHPNRFYQEYTNIRSFVNPLYFTRNFVYWDLKRFADIIVKVPAGSDTAVMEHQPGRATPPAFLRYSQGIFVTSTTLVFLLNGVVPDWLLEEVGADGSDATRKALAVGWVLLNWIIY